MGIFNRKKEVNDTDLATSFLDLQEEAVRQDINKLSKRQTRDIVGQIPPEHVTKSFDRLSKLEVFKNTHQPIINKNKHDIEIITQKLDRIENADVLLAQEANQARKVLDSSDGTFKNVKEVFINNALNANKVWDLQTQTYRDSENIKVQNAILADRATVAVKAETAISANTAQRAENATNADNATNAALAARATIADKAIVADRLSTNARVDRADVAERILIRGGDRENYLYMDDILNGYVSKETLKDVVRSCSTFEAFKNLILNDGLTVKVKK